MLIDGVIFNVDLITILTDLKDTLNSNGILLFNSIKDCGNDIMVSCPYHKEGQEKRPSAGIRKSDGLFHCFTCGEVKSLAEMISDCFSRRDNGVFGWSWLLKHYISISTENRKPIDLSQYERNISKTVKKHYISDKEYDKYREYHPYMWKRKLTPEIVDLFDIGYDKEKRCITFPIRDIKGNILFIARRSVDTKFFNYPESAEKPLYGVYELSLLESFPTEIIVCESMLDALVCWVWGRYAVALNGLGSYAQFKELNDLPCRKLILATDNDLRGLNARKTLRKHIVDKIVTEYELPEGKKDMNDLTEEEFKNLIEIF